MVGFANDFEVQSPLNAEGNSSPHAFKSTIISKLIQHFNSQAVSSFSLNKAQAHRS